MFKKPPQSGGFFVCITFIFNNLQCQYKCTKKVFNEKANNKLINYLCLKCNYL